MSFFVVLINRSSANINTLFLSHLPKVLFLPWSAQHCYYIISVIFHLKYFVIKNSTDRIVDIFCVIELYSVMDIRFCLQLITLVPLYSLTDARTNVIAYRNENSNICNIALDLSNTGLKYLGSNFINTDCVRSLILQNNIIEHLEEDFLKNQPNLEYLDLSRNRLELHDFFSLSGESRLQVIILDHNNYHFEDNFETVIAEDNTSNDDDENSDKVKNRNNKLTVFKTFPELKHLSLRDVHINTLSEDWINHFPKLSHLDLSQNIFSSAILNFLLRNISSTVTNLVLENVGLTIVRTEHLNNVKQLNLNHNRLPRLSSHKCHDNTLCFENMDDLEILSISNCSVKYIEENAFKYMTNLLELDISNNEFVKIPDKTFNYVPSLTRLDLSRNSLCSIPNINNLQNLSSLLLDEMKIKTMLESLQALTYLPNLKFLSMRNNRLATISPTLFDNLPTLQKLDLSDNQIKSLPTWSTQKSLRQLYLNGNKIESLDDLSLEEARSLELLFLKNNSISKIKVISLKNLPNSDVLLNV